MRAEWVHPSIRDLVIDHVAASPALRREFLQAAGVDGVKLALSRGGGELGEREMPLLQTPDDWAALAERLVALLSSGSVREVRVLLAELDGLGEAVAEETTEPVIRQEAENLLGTALSALKVSWDASAAPISIGDLETYCRVSRVASPLPPIPDLRATWGSIESDLGEIGSTGAYDSAGLIERLQRFLWVARGSEPRLIDQIRWPEGYADELEALVDSVEQEIHGEAHFTTPEDGQDWPDENPVDGWLPQLLAGLEELTGFLPDALAQRAVAAFDEGGALNSSWEEYNELMSEREPDSDRWPDFMADDRHEAFDVREFFADL